LLHLETVTFALKMVDLDGSGCCRYWWRYMTVAVFCAVSLTLDFMMPDVSSWGGGDVPHHITLLGLKRLLWLREFLPR